MVLHRGCITDPDARRLWRDYQRVLRDGNPLGLSFVEYIASRVYATQHTTVTAAAQATVTWYVASCGHMHPWGAACSESAVTQ